MRRTGYIVMIPLALCAGALIIAWIALAMPAVLQPTPVGASDDTNLAFQPNPGARLPLAINLVDENGRAVALGDYFIKAPVILVLDYLRCTSLCGVTLRNLVDELERLPLQAGRDYQLVAISIDPRDTPADARDARAKYLALLEQRSGDGGMHFLTAPAADVREIAAIVGFPYRYDNLLDAYIHPAGFVITAPDGVISRYVEGVAISPPELIGALADAAQQKSQGPLARLLLLCRPRGAALGRFTGPVLAAFTIAQIAAVLTIIATFAAVARRRHG
jgi:protein SCO1